MDIKFKINIKKNKMRATGFGIKSPTDASGEFLMPMR
jgi:hypothetical protein